ncbi:hypothetical protein [Shewanella baltica]|uniref:hypothetical protein n=1 Tax=Shewanella baltica TaxID=62322 RepID=UPI003D090DD8
MRNGILLTLSYLLLFITNSTSACSTIPEDITNIIKKNHEIILVGEYHGTKESPEYFYNIICNAIDLTSKKVIVEIELIDGDIKLDGNNENLKKEVKKSHIWNSQHDGKTSIAMFTLLKELNKLKKENSIDVIFFDSEAEERDLVMAANLKEHVTKDNLVIALTGNRHNKIKHGNSWDPMSKNMGAYMKDMGINIASINLIAEGGTAWICISECAKHDLDRVKLNDKNEVFNAGSNSSYQYHWKIGIVNSSAPELFIP